ncbi:MAG: alpha/beta hydrolase, partial [Mesorhizobium sp.]
HVQGSAHWMPGANDAGRTRPERLMALCRSFEAAGARVRFDLLPGVSHERDAVLDSVKDFLAQQLKERRNASR